MNFNLTEAQRRWAYGVAVAAFAVLAFYGVLTLEGVAMWTVLVAAVLGIPTNALAAKNVGASPEASGGKHRLEG